MLEPFERYIFNFCVCTMLLVSMYSVYLFLPILPCMVNVFDWIGNNSADFLKVFLLSITFYKYAPVIRLKIFS